MKNKIKIQSPVFNRKTHGDRVFVFEMQMIQFTWTSLFLTPLSTESATLQHLNLAKNK